jgi:Na+/melibiose symporter-like transporter
VSQSASPIAWVSDEDRLERRQESKRPRAAGPASQLAWPLIETIHPQTNLEHHLADASPIDVIPPAPPADADRGGTSLIALGSLFGLLYFVQGIVEPTEGLLSQPIKSLLRNWGYSAASTAWFISVLSVAWAIKPLYGVLADFVPLAGSRRRSYLLLTTAVASISLTVVYLLPLTSERAVLLLLLLLPTAVAIAFSDVVIDAMMIAAGQPRGMTGRLQSIQWTSMYAATIVTGVAGGALSQWGMQQAGFLIAGLSCGISLLAVWFLVRERRQSADVCAEPGHPNAMWQAAPRILPSHAIAEMWRTFREPSIVAIGTFLFLWNFNPFSSTVLYYYSTEALHFSEQFVGSLTSWHAVGLLTGSILYGVICRKIPLRWLIHGSIVAGIAATIAYWGYRDATSGVVISLLVGVVYAIGSLIQLDLAARVCRPETAATTFALLMSLTNLGTALSQGIGGSIYEAMAERWGYASAFQMLVAVGAVFTAACWLLIPLLNRLILSPRKAEGEAY